MLVFIIAPLSIWGCKHHSIKSGKYDHKSKKYAYHVQMACIYVDILNQTLHSGKLRDKLLKEER